MALTLLGLSSLLVLFLPQTRLGVCRSASGLFARRTCASADAELGALPLLRGPAPAVVRPEPTYIERASDLASPRATGRMSIPGWKNFSFFDKEAPLPAGEHDVPGNATCCASGDGELVFGCADGTAVALDAALTASLRWPVHSGRVAAAVALPGTRLLVTVGEEEVGAGAATLKLWNLARIKPSTGNPELLRGVKLFQKVLVSTRRRAEAAVSGGGTVAGAGGIGCEDGSVCAGHFLPSPPCARP